MAMGGCGSPLPLIAQLLPLRFEGNEAEHRREGLFAVGARAVQHQFVGADLSANAIRHAGGMRLASEVGAPDFIAAARHALAPRPKEVGSAHRIRVLQVNLEQAAIRPEPVVAAPPALPRPLVDAVEAKAFGQAVDTVEFRQER